MRTVTIVGTGLMGTSVALALRRHGVRVHLLDCDAEAAETAAEMGAGVVGSPSGAADLVILAVPPRSIAPVLAAQQALGAGRVYTDVGSVKGWPLVSAGALGCDLSRYVGGHPIAGSERSGPRAASGTLFRDKPWVLTRHPGNDDASVAAVTELIRLCGARPVAMTQAAHDRALARTSHVPHLVSAILAATLDGADRELLALCGAGITDATRIAAGDSALWTDILQANACEVAAALADVAADLTKASQALVTGSADLTELLRRGNAGRSALLAARPRPGT
ncbi:prephenate dehydrogenase [Nocardia huaxiensis]|uniref:Prephenate dehydrogenase n=1 Tax=Nocardia huaxiensis TaxID=2755382 RepID=A0A7D6ZT98_9NOCA|nr:prephenate dehydrogenase [Nocardia huaxiensis]